MPVDSKAVMTELKERLDGLYGSRLRGVYLFGSHARGEADEESDVDVLIILDSIGNYSREIDRTSEVISGLSLSHGVAISRVFATERQWREDQSLFFLNVREEGVPA